jgi:hypothetical protein
MLIQTMLNKKICAVAASLACFVACAPIPSQAQSSYPLAAQLGKTIKLQGVYTGWTACSDSGAKTRSDWVLTYLDNGVDRCVFVSGGLPQGIVPPPSKASDGLPVYVEGTVALNEANKPYLLFTETKAATGTK